MPYIYNWDVTDLLEDLADLPNREMIQRDGDAPPPLPIVTEEPEDTRGAPFKRANRFHADNLGRWWLK